MAKLRKIPCLKGYQTGQDALRRLGKAEKGCAYKCLVCELWHTNRTGRPAHNEGHRDHIVKYTFNHMVRKRQELHHNKKGELCQCHKH